VSSCHDVGRGGLAVALAEMEQGGQRAAVVDLARAPGATLLRKDRRAFAECPGRHVVCVPPQRAPAFEASWAGLTWARVGSVGGALER
jgi:phosphoribosylformylglycinamidine synthase